ncbi:NAD(P)H-dependent oxidoreductase [Mesorhizobium sp. M0938]|uniref:NAD(P)H-dependent oxidoreductase n=1 Tax=unclassified Mesorhizobium TaxID=325217 RepID=UPI0033356CD5
MNVLIVYAHPEPTSFNAALVACAKAALLAVGHTVTVSDLYADGFDPAAGRHDFLTIANPDRFHYQSEQALAAREKAFVPEIAREQARVAAADLLVLQYPLWWGGPPAILKGWFERVLAYGFAYVDGRRFDTGVFKGRRALLSVTTGGTTARFGPDGVYGEIEKVLWQTHRLTLQYMGYSVEEPFVAYGAPRVGDEDRAAYLDEFARRVVEAAAKPMESRTDEALLESVPADAWAQTR